MIVTDIQKCTKAIAEFLHNSGFIEDDVLLVADNMLVEVWNINDIQEREQIMQNATKLVDEKSVV